MKPDADIQRMMGVLGDKGATFKTIGPLLVTDLDLLPDDVAENLAVGEHGMEEVGRDQATEAHTHTFPSFYKSKMLDVVCAGERYSLPQNALVLVLPGIDHSWVPQKSAGTVGSVDPRHEKQIVLSAA